MAKSPAFRIDPDRAGRLGDAALWGGLAAGFALLLLVLVRATDYVWVLPILLASVFAGLSVIRRYPLGLWFILLGFVTISQQEEGLQLQEVGYGLLYLGFLSYWFISRKFFYKETILKDSLDWTIFLFMAYAIFSLLLTTIYELNPAVAAGETLALSMLAFYFPIKEAVRDHHGAINAILWVLLILGVYTTFRNLLEFRNHLSDVEHLWQITKGRVATNEIVLMFASLGSLILLVYSRKWIRGGFLLGSFLVLFAGLIVTQSRGYWASFAFGCLVLFLIVGPKMKIRISIFGVMGIFGFLLVGFLFFGDAISLFAAGIVDRIGTLGSASTDDISLVNRFYETSAVWENIKESPIIGHGMGTQYRYYNVIYENTRVTAYIHNGPAALWYKFGIIGLGLVLFYWGRAIVMGYRTYKIKSAPANLRLAALIGAVCLIAEIPVANTSNPFILEDGNFMFGIVMGMIAGSTERIKRIESRGQDAPPAPRVSNGKDTHP